MFKKLLLAIALCLIPLGCTFERPPTGTNIIHIRSNALVRHIRASTVLLRVYIPGGCMQGSAVAIYKDKEYTYFLTARHMFDQDKHMLSMTVAKNVNSTISDDAISNQVFATEVFVDRTKKSDVALIKIRNNSKCDVPIAKYKYDDFPAISEIIYLTGAPAGDAGYVAEGRVCRYCFRPDGFTMGTLCETAGGVSGGGIFDKYGNLVAINSKGMENGYGEALTLLTFKQVLDKNKLSFILK